MYQKVPWSKSGLGKGSPSSGASSHDLSSLPCRLSQHGAHKTPERWEVCDFPRPDKPQTSKGTSFSTSQPSITSLHASSRPAFKQSLPAAPGKRVAAPGHQRKAFCSLLSVSFSAFDFLRDDLSRASRAQVSPGNSFWPGNRHLLPLIAGRPSHATLH